MRGYRSFLYYILRRRRGGIRRVEGILLEDSVSFLLMEDNTSQLLGEG